MAGITRLVEEMKRGTKIALGCFVICPCTCCIGGVAYVQYRLKAAGDQLPIALQRAKDNGIKTEPSELNRNVPAQENAAEEYSAAMLLAPAQSPLAKDVDKVGRVVGSMNSTPPKPEDVADAKESYRRLGVLVSTIERGADKPHMSINRDWMLGPRLMFPEYAALRSYVKLLSYKAQQQSDDGNMFGAMQTIGRMERISHHCGEESILIGMLVQVATEAITQQRLQQIVKDHSKDPSTLTMARDTLAKFGSLPDFKSALNAELVLGRVTVQQLPTMKPSDLGMDQEGQTPLSMRLMFASSSLTKAFEAQLVTAYVDQLVKMPSDPMKWEEQVKVAVEADRRVESDSSPLNTLNRILFPVFTQAPMTVGRVIAGRRLTECQIRLCQDRLKTGVFPAKLPDYGLASIDPFTKKPMIYKREGSGFTIYSVDQDRKDDGGKVKTGSSNRDMVIDMR